MVIVNRVEKVINNINRYSINSRKSKVSLSSFSKPYRLGNSFRDFIDSLPQMLSADALRDAASSIIEARKNGKPVILGMGAHSIKLGLSPIIIDLIVSGIISAVAANGACIVHDFELAYAGMTSEDVKEAICDGSFGMALETGTLLNAAISEGVKRGLGIGASIGKFIHQNQDMKYREMSIFGTCYTHKIPATVHVAIGTDIIHMHPEADGASIGEGSLRDFHHLTSIISNLDGGVFINLGSAVIIPEVFLKALSLARNLEHKAKNFTAINMDFIKQYRASENVLHRPTGKSGKAINLIGHHEIMLPLLAALIIEGKG
ncbi:MAG: hypothetical protein HQK91_10975 [Nitrospirae bacterium]|nr:hypothetical protein [Nitrospirota bacterium]MBF0541957.1 hypothetical protein [Nitrospirota bacterium]